MILLWKNQIQLKLDRKEALRRSGPLFTPDPAAGPGCLGLVTSEPKWVNSEIKFNHGGFKRWCVKSLWSNSIYVYNWKKNWTHLDLSNGVDECWELNGFQFHYALISHNQHSASPSEIFILFLKIEERRTQENYVNLITILFYMELYIEIA